jgi:hypothetical protein
MISGAILLALIGLVSYLYNLIIYPYILLFINSSLYNNITIYIIILLQIDNFSLYHELITYIREDNNKMDERYKKIISQQLAYICKKQSEINNINNMNNNNRTLRFRSSSF